MYAIALGLALAAPVLHLSELLQEARAKNPDLRAAGARARAADSSIAPAGAFDDPMLMLQLWNAPADFATAPVMIQISQNVPLGGKLEARRRAATADASLARSNVDARTLDIEADVERAYFDLFVASRTVDIDAEIDQTLHRMLDAATARVASGQGDPIDELKAQGEILKIDADGQTARAQQVAASARLAVLIDRDPSQALGTPGTPALLPSLPSEEKLRSLAMESRPEIKGAEAMVTNQEEQLRLAEAARIPDIGINAGAMYQFGGIGEHTFLFAGIQGNLPLFENEKTQPRIDAVRAQIDSQREEQRSLKNRIFADIATTYASVEAEKRFISLHHDLVPISHRILQSTLSSYGVGQGSFLAVLDSLRELQMHEIELASHLAAYEQRLVDLERAVGVDLGLTKAAEADGNMSHEERSTP